MKPLTHLFYALILAAVLYPVFGWKVILIVIGGVIADSDHYISNVFRFRDLNIVNCYKYFSGMMVKNDFTDAKGILLVFHTVEFLLLMVILSFFNEFALIFLIGLLLHYFLDLIWHVFVAKCIISNPSIIYWLIKRQSKRFK
ncbi:hypothetical protein CMO83_03015 [Candidatus Woesearchaeota archaeon]|jgi:hypothetical protein|nr:hypothetical protein [Candidatus Woesearchaeota archaeon]|tara:strand:- start:9333 stop:9758 length:426 start_codon:yes stop_codon:yes gene_type:complete